MQEFDLSRRCVAEALGTGLLVAAVVGSGIMADALTADNALALVANTIATGAILVVLITILGPLSGAHFNPAVSLVFALSGRLGRRDCLFYLVAQVTGAIAGTVIAHLMFDLSPLDISAKCAPVPRSGFRRRSRPSAWSPPSSPASASVARQYRGSSVSTSQPPTGSPPPRPSPIQQSHWLGH